MLAAILLPSWLETRPIILVMALVSWPLSCVDMAAPTFWPTWAESFWNTCVR